MLAFRLHHPAPPAPVTPMTPASSPRSRAADALAFFDERLVGHFRAEETALFPFLRARAVGHGVPEAVLDELVAEHRRLEVLRDAIASADGEPALDTALGTFADLLEAHVRREERELFEPFPEAIPAEDTEALAAAIRAALAGQAAR
jgi:hemerythrin superfamily protein